MKQVITAVGYEDDIIQVKLMNVTKHPKYIAKIFETLGNYNVNIDMISQVMLEGSVLIEFTVNESEQNKLNDAIAKIKEDNETMGIYQNKTISKVFVYGKGMETESGVAAGVFKVLGDNHITFYQVTTSTTDISFVIDKENRELAVEKITAAYNL